MKEGYFVTDDGLIAVQGLTSIVDAKREAESMINEIPFGDIGTMEILHFNGSRTKTHLRFDPVINWEKM